MNSTEQHTNPIKSVWIIEDHENTRSLLGNSLNNSGEFRCTLSVGSCEEAFTALQHGSHPDIILLDHHLPGIMGITALKQFKQLIPNVRIIVMTVDHELETILAAMNNGASGFYWKRGGPANLFEMLTDVRDGGCPIDSYTAKKIIERFIQPKSVEHTNPFTPQQQHVLEHLHKGKTIKEIASEFSLSYNTINDHRKEIYKKLDVHSRTAAVTKALEEGFI